MLVDDQTNNPQQGAAYLSTKKGCLLNSMMVPAFRQDKFFTRPLTFWIVRKATNGCSRLSIQDSISILLSGSPAAPRRLSGRSSEICLCSRAKERPRWYHHKVQINRTMVAQMSRVLGIETILASSLLSLMALRYRHQTTVRVLNFSVFLWGYWERVAGSCQAALAVQIATTWQVSNSKWDAAEATDQLWSQLGIFRIISIHPSITHWLRTDNQPHHILPFQ